MTKAGMNCSVQIIRLVDGDDEVGGSYPTGTILHPYVEARIHEELADTTLLQQGYQTKKIFSARVWGFELSMREQDEVQVISPPNHPYFGKRFRIVSCQSPDNHIAQKRNTWNLKLERSQIAHGESYQ